MRSDEIPIMSGKDALFSLSSGVLLMMTGARKALDESTLTEQQIKRLWTAYAALAASASELTHIGAEIDKGDRERKKGRRR